VEILSAEPQGERVSKLPLRETANWRVVQRIVGSEIFAKSELLPKFLSYICERQLRGKTHEITEQQIGERVFGRPAGYNPGEDNIVRNYAGQLRKRLELYYEREGKEDEICISIPRGTYVPVFHPRNPGNEIAKPGALPTAPSESRLPEGLAPVSLPQASIVPVAPPATVKHSNWRFFLSGFALCALIFIVAFLFSHARHDRPAYSTSRPLWSKIFSTTQDTFIVPADSGLGILQNLTEQQVALADYANGKFLSNLKTREMTEANLDDLRTQRYTSIVDLSITSRLARLPEVIPDRFVVRYARDLRMDDLRNGNAILLGAIHTDPWINLLQQQLNFQFNCESQVNNCSIVNMHPAPGEKKNYSSDPQNPLQQTYALIAFLPNLSKTGHILLISGLNMAGTQAAADVLLDEASMKPIIERVTQPDGSLKPFELLVVTGSLDAEALPSRIIASRYGP
jgi:hypothetical protein